MRDFKLRVRIIWYLLTNRYTSSKKYQAWWLWDGTTKITLSKQDFIEEYEYGV